MVEDDMTATAAGESPRQRASGRGPSPEHPSAPTRWSSLGEQQAADSMMVISSSEMDPIEEGSPTSPSSATLSCPISRKLSWLRAGGPRRARAFSWTAPECQSHNRDRDEPKDVRSPRLSPYSLFRKSARGSLSGRQSFTGGSSSMESMSSVDSRAARLERALFEDDKLREDLVVALLAAHVPQGHLKVRFLEAVADYENTNNRRQRLAKGAKIISMFARHGSLFKIDNLSSSTRIRHLESTKTQVLLELMEEPVVIKFFSDKEESMTELRLS